MMRNSFIFIILLGFGFILFRLFSDFQVNEDLNNVASFYAAKENIEEVGAANLVTAVVVTYRGLDTLGEVTILFLTAAIIGFFLKITKNNEDNKHVSAMPSEILSTASAVLTPVIFVLGIYVFINGHLTPGGGFQGGAIIASAFVLMLLTNSAQKFTSKLFTIIESISGISFIIIGVLGLVLAGGFLDNRIIAMGEFGTLLSAGAIPVIYLFIGLKVGSELSNILGNFNQIQEDN